MKTAEDYEESVIETPAPIPSDGSINDPEEEQEVKKEVLSEEEEIRTASVFSTIINLINGVVGAGVLAFPYSYYCTGIIMGLIISFIVVGSNFLAVHVIMVCSYRKGGLRSYQTLIGLYLGRFWKKVAEVLILTMVTGILIVYIMIISQFIKPVIDSLTNGYEYFFNNSRMIVLFFSFTITYPLILLREIKRLSIASFIANCASFFLCGFIIIEGIIKVSTQGLPNPEFFKKIIFIQTDFYKLNGKSTFYPLLFLGPPIKFFGYACQALVVPVSYELKNGSVKKMDFVAVVAVGITLTIYVMVGLFGLFSFGENVSDNVLNNFDGLDIFANIARALVGFNVISSIPIINYLARLTIISLIYGRDKKLGTVAHVSITTTFFLVCLLVALFVPNVSVIFGITGAIAVSTIIFLFQSLLTWKVLAKEAKTLCMKIVWKCVSVLSMMIFIFFMVTGVTASIFKLITSFD